MISIVKLVASTFAALAFLLLARQSSIAETLVAHRLPAALALEAVGEVVSVCAIQNHHVTATVINPDGARIAILHGDGSGLHTIEASYSKAFAAVSFAAPVLNLETSGQLGEKYGKLPNFQPPAGMLFRAGGIVIKQGDEVIGAIGVGGAPDAAQDEACAKAGIDKIRDRIK